MINMYSINFPAAICILLLGGVFIFHVFKSRENEFQSMLLPSGVDLKGADGKLTIRTENDLVLNSRLKFERIECGNLIVGPEAVLEGNAIVADKIIVKGSLKRTKYVTAMSSMEVYNSVEVGVLTSPKLILRKKSTAFIQIVPPETHVVAKKGAQTRGFFRSIEELHMKYRGASQLETRLKTATSYSGAKRVASVYHMPRK